MKKKNKKKKQEQPVDPNIPMLKIVIERGPDGALHIDEDYNAAFVNHLDQTYHAASREDYRPNWTNDRKIAFLIYDIMEEIMYSFEESDSQSRSPFPDETPIVRSITKL